MHRLILILLMCLLPACSLSSNNDETPTPETEQLPQATSEATEEVVQTAPTAQLQPTDLPIPTASIPTFTPAPTSAPQIAPVLNPVSAGQRVYALGNDGGIQGGGLNLLDLQIDHYSANPADNRYAVIDQAGMLYITGPGATNAFRIEQGPYTQFPSSTRADNNGAADLSRWSPNGQYLAFIVNGDKQAADGVWYFEPGAWGPLQLIVDCPSQGFIGCNIVRPSPRDNFSLWESRDIAWAPDGSALLVSVSLPNENRRGILLKPVTRDERTRDERPVIWLYDYGSFGSDGRILASGRNPDGVAGVYWLNRDGNLAETLNSGAGLWLGWANESAGGRVYALGRAGSPDGAVAIYDMDGNALTDFIGAGFPERVVWSPDGTAVLIETAGRQYVAEISGQVTDITAQTNGLAVNWDQ